MPFWIMPVNDRARLPCSPVSTDQPGAAQQQELRTIGEGFMRDVLHRHILASAAWEARPCAARGWQDHRHQHGGRLISTSAADM